VNTSRVYLPQADLPTVILARRLCGGVEGLPVSGGLALRVSGGLACWPSHGHIIHRQKNSQFKT
jgi:hypothetical protein